MSHQNRLLVCVTQQKTCERLIRKAAEIRDTDGGDLFVLHVAKNEWKFLDNAKECEALEYLFGISKSVGANLTVLRSDKIVETIIEYVKENNINFIIMGESLNDHQENHFYNELKNSLQSVEILVMPRNEML